MPDRNRGTPPTTDPRRGKNPGYAEDQPRGPADAKRPAIPSQPTPDEPGIDHEGGGDPAPRSR
jgi:hypothetical protein